MKSSIFYSMLLMLSTNVLFAQNSESDKKDPIDIRLETCLSIDSNQTTLGMMECEIIARDEWDAALNKYYKLLMDTLPAEEKAKLKSVQIAWLNYCNKENDFSSTMYYNMQGTMWRIAAASRSSDINRQRALELKGYFDTLTFDK